MAQELKYAYLSEPDPTFLPLKETVDAQYDQFWSLPHDEFTKAWKSMPVMLPEGTPMDLEINHMTIPVRDGHKIRIRIYRNRAISEAKLKEGKNAPLVLIFHGGGWILGSHEVEEGIARWTAKETGAVIVDVEYRLAPEYKYPFAVNDCYDAFKWCKENSSLLKIDSSHIVVCGSSAGGNLTAVVAQMARDQKEAGIIGQVLNGPVICHPNHFPKGDKYEYNSWEQNANASILSAKTMLKCWDMYYPSAGADVYASPLLADSLKGLPSALIQITGMDPLRDEAFAYADRLKEAGVHVDVETWPGLPHGFYTIPHLPATTEYYKKSAAWIKKLLASEGWQT